MFFTRAASSILKVNLGLKKGEHVLIFTDRPITGETDLEREKIKEFCLILRDLAESLGCKAVYAEYPETGMHGMEPPERLWKIAFGEKTVQALKKKRLLSKLIKKKIEPDELKVAEDIIKRNIKAVANAVIALSRYSTSHTNFRDLLTRICKSRYASMPLFEVSMLEGPMSIDWKALAKRTRSIASKLKEAEFIKITAPNGTDLLLSKKGRKVYTDTGILTRPGSFGNLPAGEVFLAPVEGKAEGLLVIEWAPTRQLSSPLKIRIEKGRVINIEGNEPFREELMKKLQENPLNANIAELGIGTNDGAKRPDNILESEKILGTVHIALGDNSSFGGKIRTPLHQDFVIFRPTVILIKGKKEKFLIKDGKIL
ncbi:MAG: aminopeptidase [Thermodesulfovibrionales bacterium]|nr:aminopeptidase [Thermodesulfovibrionales bacterium]